MRDTLPPFVPEIQARDLRVCHAGRPVLDLSGLTLAPGTGLAVTGPSGSGKSTLLLTLAGIVAPAAGNVVWDGVDLARLGALGRDRLRRRRLGLVFQDLALIGALSPLQNVLLPVGFDHFRVPAALRARGQALLQRFGVPGRGRADQLSRGEQGRVALARALILDPPVIFADEPTAALDATSGAQVAAALADLVASGRTVLAVTHDPGLAAAMGAQLRLEQGRIAPGGAR